MTPTYRSFLIRIGNDGAWNPVEFHDPVSPMRACPHYAVNLMQEPKAMPFTVWVAPNELSNLYPNGTPVSALAYTVSLIVTAGA